MKKESKRSLCFATCMLGTFFLWTLAIRFIDVQTIGPQESAVGFATLNQLFHDFTGIHIDLYTITDWLSLVPLGLGLGFASLGLIQWFKRKHFVKVDYSILVLGVFYILVILVYALFEMFVINYRPVLINGYLEASYPSSTTMLVMCVMLTSIMQFHARIKNVVLKRCVTSAITAYIIFMVIGRLISGVHWLTDIIGGVLLSVGLVLIYRAVIPLNDR